MYFERFIPFEGIQPTKLGKVSVANYLPSSVNGGSLKRNHLTSWDLLKEKCEEAFEHLQSYVKQHGNSSVPSTHVTSDGFKLGSWVSGQRKRKSKNLLSQDRIERLETLAGWVWSFKKEAE